ncbi:MAG: ribonuclease HII [Nitrososphaerales archaeon]|nr:ribonuclease HII [Nitrososphaerales archaeon]
MIGALVVAGVSVKAETVRSLKRMGVRDSKTLSASQRDRLYDQILEKCERVSTVQITPSEIDAVVSSGKKYRKLNHLEAIYFAKVIGGLGATKVIVDASDTSPRRFRSVIMENLRRRCTVVAAHKADRDFPVVSAASIVAKVERDRSVEKLRRKLGDFGSGYPSDPKTRAFFKEKMARGEPLPESARKSWKTWKRFGQSVFEAAGPQ